jgi:hypothetical protein
MDLLQSMRRLGQQSKGLAQSFIGQNQQQLLIKKLYENNGLEIKMTCGACPEQYEVFKDGKQVAYYRLRHGEFRVDYPDCGGETIYYAEPNGDGIFDDEERLVYLTTAMRKVLEAIAS